jgi:NAD(P)-dependent dehydrogenase (short-subunit alcohol dehydrogenase family)
MERRYLDRMQPSSLASLPSLAQQHVLVAGGSSGIGLGVARACLDAGASVTLVGRAADRLAAARDALGGDSRVAVAPADLTIEDDVRRLFEPAAGAAEGRPIDHVVITAADLRYRPIHELDLRDARTTIDSKLVAALHVAKHARLPVGGSLTLTTGVAADRPSPGGALVAAVNGALNALVRALAVELAPRRVNAISPGWIDTPLWDAIAGDDKPRRMAAQAARLPVGRVGQPADIGQAAIFLMSNGFTTGETLYVDGGHRLV